EASFARSGFVWPPGSGLASSEFVRQFSVFRPLFGAMSSFLHCCGLRRRPVGVSMPGQHVTATRFAIAAHCVARTMACEARNLIAGCGSHQPVQAPAEARLSHMTMVWASRSPTDDLRT